RTEVHLVGRLEGGETFAVVERRVTPFFYVRAADESRAREISERDRVAADVIASDRRTMDGEAVIRLETPTTSASQRLRDSLHSEGIRTYEADIKPSVQYLMGLRIHGAAAIQGGWRKGRRVDRIYENPAIGPAEMD